MKTILVDFDGVLHSYTSGWRGENVIPDPPVPGAIEFLTKAVERFEVCIYSSRSSHDGGTHAMIGWLLSNGLPQEVLSKIAFPTTKPAASLTIDDRAFCFRGTFPSLDEIDSFKPWNK